jgi:hypothetical protein
MVVIGKKKNGAPTVGASKKPKETPLINLSDDKEVSDFLEKILFHISFISMLLV